MTEEIPTGHSYMENDDADGSKRELAIRIGARLVIMQEASALWAAKREAARAAPYTCGP